ncbi:VOC family protein [Conexibacter woesei]|uniref:Glyoxalase/bleomycin resistance protein/dioxygenase n=1 Tax=Conexibacter woesei (strain DSM 14684 / CCUG 47730 / CIP 108061 / JCM 11494 / NBRC 100937 / ID131577) TaxID=469383 RepID=D3F5P6_CONWI|nr:VOC family protein [Conexibacter woesei]ADB52595.1 Glyoxalase/bleomycin resistance protein/dioxygenase [Conexibacter woesei DSM 14684]
MPQISSIFPVLMTDDVPRAHAFYADLLGLSELFVVDWYVALAAPEDNHVQFAIVARDHSSVPAAFRKRCAGVLVTVEVDDVDTIHARAVERGLPFHIPLRDEPWGQRHFITEDPDGVLVDVIKVIAPSPEYAALYAGTAS